MRHRQWNSVWRVAVLALAFAVRVTAQETHEPTTNIVDFQRGIQFNGGSVITGGPGDQDSALTLPPNSIGGAEVSGIGLRVIFCGDSVENGPTFLGPALAVLGGNASADTSIGSVACSTLDSATEATADAPVLANVAVKVKGLYCKTNAVLAGTETVVFTLRSAAADTTPVIGCTLAAGETDCRSLLGSTTNIAGGATMAVSAVQTSNNADGDDHWCLVDVMMQ